MERAEAAAADLAALRAADFPHMTPADRAAEWSRLTRAVSPRPRRDAIELARDPREVAALAGGEVARRGSSWLSSRPDAAAAIRRAGLTPETAADAYREDLDRRLHDGFFTPPEDLARCRPI